MNLKLTFRPRARSDIAEIWDYTVEKWSVEQANFYLLGLDALLNTLREFPEIARLREELEPPVRIHTYKSHVVIYQSDELTVEVIRVVHSRSNWQNFLAE